MTVTSPYDPVPHLTVSSIDASTQTDISLFPAVTKDFTSQAPEYFKTPANVHGVINNHYYSKKCPAHAATDKGVTSTPSKKKVTYDGDLSLVGNLSMISSPNKSFDWKADSDYEPEPESLISQLDESSDNDDTCFISEEKVCCV